MVKCECDMVAPRGKRCRREGLFGKVEGDKYAKEDATGILYLAWRSLYAEQVASGIENKDMDLQKAYCRVLIMAITRLKAYGTTWKIWHVKKTKIPVLLNTSFNIKEPIVETPKDAYDCFKRSKIDVLVINNYIIKRNVIPSP